MTRFPRGCETIEAHLKLLLPRLGINCVLDVGANVGQYGRLLRSIGYNGLLISFEPVREPYMQLAEFARRDDQWLTFPYALGDTDGVQPMNVTHSTDFSSFLPTNASCTSIFGGGGAVVSVEEVQVRQLDTALGEHVANARDLRMFLKMDTQGYDHMVLRGANGALPRILGIQSEISVRPIYDGTVHYLTALGAYEEIGYQLTGLFPVNRDPHLRLIELECVMAHRAAVSGSEPAIGASDGLELPEIRKVESESVTRL